MSEDMTAQQKRAFEEVDAADSFLEGVKVIILDIEGTTTPFTFVKENLMPYVRNNLKNFLTTKYDQDETKADIKCLRELAEKDKKEGKDVTEIPEAKDDNKDDVIKAVVTNVLAQMDEDRKTTALKDLQGHMWREAYESNEVVGELFEDVNPVCSQLSEEGYKLFVYSSGSSEAQELLFRNSIDGDICELFTKFFDTRIGPKKEAASYIKLKNEIEAETGAKYDDENLLFLTDCPEEAAAARQAHYQVIIVDRSMEQEGGIDIDAETRKNFTVIESLNDLFGDDDDDEELGMMKRPHLEDNGDLDDDEDDDEEDDDEDDEDDDGLGAGLGGEDDDDDDGVQLGEDEDDDGEDDDEEEEA